EIVLAEAVNARGEAADTAIQKLQEAINQASKIMSLEPIYLPDRSEVVSAWQQELESAFRVIPVNGEHAVEALKREAARRRPAREGKGGRDSAIWLGVLEEASSSDVPVHFVSD